MVQRFSKRYIITYDSIKQNIFLLESHPENFLEILHRVPSIGSTSIQDITCRNPKILMRPVSKILKIIEILKEYNIPEQGFIWYSNVLTLSPETVRERAASLYADPVFQPFFCSPRIAFIITRYHTTMSRYQLLTAMKWRCLSTALLTNIDDNFNKQIDLGHDESRSMDVIYYLQRHLGYGKKELRDQLKRHPFYFLLPLTTVTETLQFLLANNMEKTEIFKALPIVLYPKNKVARWLTEVHLQPEVQHMCDEERKLPQSLVLQLLLYYMERPHHFSGHGVWSEEDINIVNSLSLQ